MPGFVVAVMMCAGTNCFMAQPEPEVSYPTYEACTAATVAHASTIEAFVKQNSVAGRQPSVVCLSQTSTILEVEEPHDVLDTAIIHAEPSAGSGYVGVVEKGQRTLVTGRVSGTQWVRVLLKDGTSGFVFADRLRKVGATVVAPTANSTPTPPRAADLPVAPPPAALPPPAKSQVALAPPPQASPTVAAAPHVASGESRDCENCPTMIAIPAGTFTMGSNDDPTEKPVRKVAVAAFAIGKYVVTAAEWAGCTAAGACAYKPPAADGDPARTPMSNLSFSDASEYVAWLRQVTGKPYRLPSEAEWEYAARAGGTTRYSWGEQVGNGEADCEGCGGRHNARRPALVDQFRPNRFGVTGMSGGVSEWVEDCWHGSYQGAPSNGSPWPAPGCARHVLRGGSWNNGPRDITVSARNFYDTSVRYVANGLRVASGR